MNIPGRLQKKQMRLPRVLFTSLTDLVLLAGGSDSGGGWGCVCVCVRARVYVSVLRSALLTDILEPARKPSLISQKESNDIITTVNALK